LEASLLLVYLPLAPVSAGVDHHAPDAFVRAINRAIISDDLHR
jgi:hypothetical protein